MTTTASSISTVEPRILQSTGQLGFAAHSIIDVLALQPLQIFVAKSSAKVVHLPKHMTVAYVTKPLMSVMTVSSTPFNESPIRNSESLEPIALNDVHPTTHKTRKITADDEALPA